jgi:hypothetical protein
MTEPATGPAVPAHPGFVAWSRGRWFVAALYLAALLFQLAAMRRQITYYDESLELYCAERVLHGQLPYRDFWTMYGPAQFYVLAGFFKLFGSSVLTGRLYDALVKAGIVCMCFLLVERLASRRSAAFAFAASLLCLTCNTSAIYNFPVYPALLCGLVAFLFLSRFLAEPARLRLIFVSGIFTGIATTFRHDSGFYICFAECFTLAWTAQCRSGTPAPPMPAGLLRTLAAYLSGVMAVFLPVLAWLLWKIPRHDLYFNLVYMPGVVYPKVRSLPFPTFRILWPFLHPFGEMSLYALEDWVVYLPMLVFGTAFATLLFSRKPPPQLWDAPWQRLAFGGLALLDALLFVKGLIRVSELQELQSIVVAIALAAVMISRRPHLGRGVRIPVLAGGLVLLGYLCLLLWHAETFVRWNVRDIVRWKYRESLWNTCRPPAGLERTRCLVVDRQTVAAVEYVQRLTTPADEIYVGAGRHDRLTLNDVRFYFVSGRASVTKWYDLHPGVQTTLPIQNEIVDSLRRQSPKVVVLNYAFDEVQEPNASQYSSGVTALDDYIREHYTESASFGAYAVLVPKQPVLVSPDPGASEAK